MCALFLKLREYAGEPLYRYFGAEILRADFSVLTVHAAQTAAAEKYRAAAACAAYARFLAVVQ